MLKLFHSNIIVQVALLLVAMLLLWGRQLLAPVAVEAGEHPAVLYGWLCGWLVEAPRLTVVIAMVLVLAEGVLLNLLLANVGLVSQNSLLPTLLFVIAMSAGTATLTPMVLVGGVLIACLDQLVLRGTLLTITPGKACGATLLISLASLFYQPALLMVLSYLLIAASYRLYGWKDWGVMILGLLAPYLPLVLALWFTDELNAWWQTTLASFSDFGIHLGTAETWATVGAIALAGVLLWSVMNVISRLGERPVVWQRNAATVVYLTVGAVGMLCFAPLLPFSPALFAIPFAFCTYRLLVGASETHTGFGRRKKHTWLYDILLIVILIAALLC